MPFDIAWILLGWVHMFREPQVDKAIPNIYFIFTGLCGALWNTIAHHVHNFLAEYWHIPNRWQMDTLLASVCQ